MNTYPVFWNTQGNISYDTNKDHFNYETSMSINWNNKLARKVLIHLIKFFNHPYILDSKSEGIAIWNYDTLKNLTFYNKPLLFNELILRDLYIMDNNNTFIQTYPFLTINYNIKLNNSYNNIIVNCNDYINYDSIRHMISIKSRTIEENIVILDLILNKKIEKKKDLIEMKNKITKKMNKNSIYLQQQMRLLIDNLNSSFKFNKYIFKNASNIIKPKSKTQPEIESEIDSEIDSENELE